MNEHIKQLADEAAQYSAVMALPTGESGDQLFVEQFARLIVRECVNVVDNMANPEDSDGYFWAIQNASQKIKQHFGVEE